MQKKIFQIAIDGPVGAGKSTVAKLVAEKLGIVYIDTGAMYRAVALYVRRNNGKFEDEQLVGELVKEVKVELKNPKGKTKAGRNVTVLLNGEDVSWEVRKAEMGEGASVVSQFGAVRAKLVSLQQEMAKGQSVIMEGRDIGTRVLPEAEIKIYLDAKPKERAKRKQQQVLAKGEKITLAEAEKDVETRDRREMRRRIDPLRPAKGAWIFDTTKLSITEVVERIVAKARTL